MSRNDFDFYPTPPAAIHALGAWLKKTMPGYLDGVWLDPCVGAGAIPLWLSPYLEKGTPPSEKGAPPSEKGTPPFVSWDALDVQPRMLTSSLEHNVPYRIRAGRALDSLTAAWRPIEVHFVHKPSDGGPPHSGSLAITPDGPYTGIAMNPPYGADCERWILKAVQEARAGVVGTHRPKP